MEYSMQNSIDFNTVTLLEEITVTDDNLKDLINFVIKKSNKSIPDEYISNQIINSIKITIPNKINFNQLLYFIADFFANKIKDHYYYEDLASMFAVYRLHLETPDKYSEVIDKLINYKDRKGDPISLINNTFYEDFISNKDKIDSYIDSQRDYLLDYFSIRTLERSYLMRSHEKNSNKFYKNDKDGFILERPQYLFMRVAVAIWGRDLDKVFETYDLMSNKYFTHATPTLFNSGTIKQQLSSCFLMHMGDSLEAIFKSLTDMAKISKWAGGIGIHLSEVRAKGSLIRGTNGLSDGIIPLCVLMNQEGRYINQGGKRNGSIAVYMEPWHADIRDFLELRLPTGDEKLRARDLFLALWVPDIFMKRVQENGKWSLMCPDECPGLVDSHSDKFEELYLKYESEGRYREQINAMDLWQKILTSQIETGMPYICYKDHCNKKSNQKNLGTIRSSNLCSEIIQFSDATSTAVCNLSSICLPRFIEDGQFNFEKLAKIAGIATRNLNKVIDINFYPIDEAKYSNFKNRPIGLGVQGLADVYNIFGYAFGSPEAHELNKKIFETIYYGSVKETIELAKEQGKYDTFEGSPFSEGKLQFDLWNLDENKLYYDWSEIKKDLVKYGARNSLLTAVMPTASTSQIMTNSEAIEPYMSNIFVRSTLAGEFIVVNKNLMKELIKENLWNDSMRKKIILANGSIQHIHEIPQRLKDIYKTAFEIKQRDIIQQSIDRAPFIDQSQSLNLFLDKSDFDRLTSAHFYGWKNGIKTGMYYLRSQPATIPINFGIGAKEEKQLKDEDKEETNKEEMCKWKPGMKLSECEMCSA